MNIALRKLALLEKEFEKQEEQAKIQGYTTISINRDLQRKIVDLMDRVRVI